MMKVSEAYQPRTVRSLGEWAFPGWRFKVYSISYQPTPVSRSLIDAAKVVAIERVRATAPDHNHYGVGFIGIHEGKTGNFVFVDWWADENELHHHVYVSSSVDPAALEYATPTGLAACVWDLSVIGFERDAWVENILNRPRAPDLDGYLNSTAAPPAGEPASSPDADER